MYIIMLVMYIQITFVFVICHFCRCSFLLSDFLCNLYIFMKSLTINSLHRINVFSHLEKTFTRQTYLFVWKQWNCDTFHISLIWYWHFCIHYAICPGPPLNATNTREILFQDFLKELCKLIFLRYYSINMFSCLY